MVTYTIIGCIIFFAGIIQGSTSFGFSLVAIPLLALFLPLQIITPLVVIYSLILNIFILMNLKGSANKKQVIILICSGLLTIPVGTHMLLYVDEQILKLLVGFCILLSAIFMMLGFQIRFKNKILSEILAGSLSGLLNGSTSLAGPPVILLLSNEGIEKERFKKTLSQYFVSMNLLTIPALTIHGLIHFNLIKFVIMLLPALISGLFIGVYVGKYMAEEIFRKIILSLVILMGGLSIVSSFPWKTFFEIVNVYLCSISHTLIAETFTSFCN